MGYFYPIAFLLALGENDILDAVAHDLIVGTWTTADLAFFHLDDHVGVLLTSDSWIYPLSPS